MIRIVFRKSLLWACIVSFIFVFQYSCGKKMYSPVNSHISSHGIKDNQAMSRRDSLAIAKMPQYYKFLTTLKEEGYEFMDFRTYLHTDTSGLPGKLLVLRHDVHYRDIEWAYYAFQIEKMVIGSGHSTFYILLNDPEEIARSGKQVENDYMGLIRHLDSNHVDIEPHISPIDLYIDTRHPYWAKDPVDTLKKLFDRNYEWDINKNGRKLVVKGKDVFRMNDINHELITILPKYNREWTKLTRLPVEGYAAHGSATPMNKVLNNEALLDQSVLLKTGIYKYDTYNSKIFNVLSYLSDNTLPTWMSVPGNIAPGRYQLLMHPYQWSLNRRALLTTFDHPTIIPSDSIIHDIKYRLMPMN
ncbi:MAG TPA: hypothetical protein VK179_11000 [Bacteroidales bacterium]|nr:hypothetical protein [Bacteroidales bacterium]